MKSAKNLANSDMDVGGRISILQYDTFTPLTLIIIQHEWQRLIYFNRCSLILLSSGKCTAMQTRNVRRRMTLLLRQRSCTHNNIRLSLLWSRRLTTTGEWRYSITSVCQRFVYAAITSVPSRLGNFHFLCYSKVYHSSIYNSTFCSNSFFFCFNLL